jgi:hypothetical protein
MVDIMIKNKSLFGLSRGWKIDSQTFKDELRDTNGKTYSPKEYIELRNSVNSDR